MTRRNSTDVMASSHGNVNALASTISPVGVKEMKDVLGMFCIENIERRNLIKTI